MGTANGLGHARTVTAFRTGVVTPAPHCRFTLCQLPFAAPDMTGDAFAYPFGGSVRGAAAMKAAVGTSVQCQECGNTWQLVAVRLSAGRGAGTATFIRVPHA